MNETNLKPGQYVLYRERTNSEYPWTLGLFSHSYTRSDGVLFNVINGAHYRATSYDMIPYRNNKKYIGTYLPLEETKVEINEPKESDWFSQIKDKLTEVTEIAEQYKEVLSLKDYDFQGKSFNMLRDFLYNVGNPQTKTEFKKGEYVFVYQSYTILCPENWFYGKFENINNGTINVLPDDCKRKWRFIVHFNDFDPYDMEKTIRNAYMLKDGEFYSAYDTILLS